MRTSQLTNIRFYISPSSGPVVAVEHGNVKTLPVEGNDVTRRKHPEISNIFSAALEKSDIVDTNGAGDAFVGGFLAQWVLGNVSR